MREQDGTKLADDDGISGPKTLLDLRLHNKGFRGNVVQINYVN